MVVFNIALSYIKRSLRDKKTMAIMTVFPIVLIIILGAAFSNVNEGKVHIDDIKLVYMVKGEGQLSNILESFCEEASKEEFLEGFTWEIIDDEKVGIDYVEKRKCDGFLIIDEEDGKFNLIKNEKNIIESAVLETMLTSLVQQIKVSQAIIKYNPEALKDIFSKSISDGTEAIGLNEKPMPRALDYYGVTMTTLIILYATLTGLDVIGELEENIGKRIIISPLSKNQIFLGYTLGGVTITIIQAAIVVGVSKFILGVNWGNNILIILFILLCEILMAISIGMGIAYIFSDYDKSQVVLQTIIPILVFLGGGYFSIDSIGVLKKVSVISPIKWVNEAIFNSVYANDYSTAVIFFFIALLTTVLFLILSHVGYRKEA